MRTDGTPRITSSDPQSSAHAPSMVTLRSAAIAAHPTRAFGNLGAQPAASWSFRLLMRHERVTRLRAELPATSCAIHAGGIRSFFKPKAARRRRRTRARERLVVGDVVDPGRQRRARRPRPTRRRRCGSTIMYASGLPACIDHPPARHPQHLVDVARRRARRSRPKRSTTARPPPAANAVGDLLALDRGQRASGRPRPGARSRRSSGRRRPGTRTSSTPSRTCDTPVASAASTRCSVASVRSRLCVAHADLRFVHVQRRHVGGEVQDRVRSVDRVASRRRRRTGRPRPARRPGRAASPPSRRSGRPPARRGRASSRPRTVAGPTTPVAPVRNTFMPAPPGTNSRTSRPPRADAPCAAPIARSATVTGAARARHASSASIHRPRGSPHIVRYSRAGHAGRAPPADLGAAERGLGAVDRLDDVEHRDLGRGPGEAVPAPRARAPTRGSRPGTCACRCLAR